jgi:hypothetical protein
MYEIVSNQFCLRNGVTRHSFGSCSGLTKTTENLAVFGFVVLIYTGNDGGRVQKTTVNLILFVIAISV